MSLFKRTRKKAKLSKSEMAAILKRSLASYGAVDKAAKRYTAKELDELIDIHIKHGGSLESWRNLLKLSAKYD